LVGAMMATAMSANVFFWIIPGQKTVIAQMKAGLPVEPIHGKRGKQRSVHNTYFTLPVLIAMISNHYGWLYQGPFNWLVLVALMVAGALIRHSFVARHKAKLAGRPFPWSFTLAGIGILVALAIALMPKPTANKQAPSEASTSAVSYMQVKQILEQRCAMCHNASLAQKNVALHEPALVKQFAQQIYQQAVVQKLMPLNNATQMTDSEREVLKIWFEQGAKVQ
jgi:uncharacterized membrane protein